jgi:hypothetical protein
MLREGWRAREIEDKELADKWQRANIELPDDEFESSDK